MRALAAALLLCLAVLAGSPPATQAASMVVTPSAGAPDDTFAISGQGLAAGMALDVAYLPPGETALPADSDRTPVADADGDFAFEFTPVAIFPVAPTGEWLVQVCVTGTDECLEAAFRIEH